MLPPAAFAVVIVILRVPEFAVTALGAHHLCVSIAAKILQGQVPRFHIADSGLDLKRLTYWPPKQFLMFIELASLRLRLSDAVA